jgi:hypothetical protein
VPHKTRVPATRPAAVSSTLVSPSSRVGRFPAREPAHLQLMQVTDQLLKIESQFIVSVTPFALRRACSSHQRAIT